MALINIFSEFTFMTCYHHSQLHHLGISLLVMCICECLLGTCAAGQRRVECGVSRRRTSTTEHPEVMPTRPARVPLEAPIRSHTMWPVAMYSKAIRRRSVERVPPAAERVVLIAEMATTSPAPMMASAEPGLKPYQPNQRMKTPRIAREALWPGMDWGCTAGGVAGRGALVGASGAPVAGMQPVRMGHWGPTAVGASGAPVARYTSCMRVPRRLECSASTGFGRGGYLAISIKAADARSNHKGTSEGSESTGHVDNTAARKIDNTSVKEEVTIGPEC